MTFIDPALNEFTADQKRVLQSFAGHLPPVPNSEMLLPAEIVSLPDYPHCNVRVIRPEGKLRGVYLHIHGGGFQFGSAERSDAANSMLARSCQFATVSVDYRLAPQYVFPAQLQDCLAAANWLVDCANQYFDSDVLLIGGDSVGATLAVQTLLQLRDSGRRHKLFRAANLVFGNYDFSMTPSQLAATSAHFLSPDILAGIRAAAFPDKSLTELRDASISPLYADLYDLPAACFTVGTDDSVLDDSLFMTQRWLAAGNRAQINIYPEAPHLFLNYPTKMAEKAFEGIFRFLQDAS
ncbi:alpha/beta hydrolase [Pseudomaricurvus alcaniphilus]|uniref:alpha/beta hydrolase n=1 Tax=Pseudomaricurvus alcaniphilus TaxID=1166482 RepID=UPI001408681F|nr:alpha/beta hydrolase [Pseudomaricurvus alcaniphilus]NHN39975.1 alpha/beta hydrolase [Pseudomaricurvus alcaniphilus]